MHNYIEIEEEGDFCAELSYLTLSSRARRAGEFDVTVCRVDDAGEPVEFRTIGRVDLARSHQEMAEARIEFDTRGLL